MPRLLLHICCAPDATVAIERLRRYGEVVGLFYNPNIEPATEYRLREAETRRLAMMEGIEYVEETPDYEGWLQSVAGYEDEPERGERCRRCITHRLERTAGRAVQLNIPAFATTLSVSPHKDVEFIHRVGAEIAARRGLEYIAETLRKQDGFRRSVELSRKFGLYRQGYCGCRWSVRTERRQEDVKVDAAGI